MPAGGAGHPRDQHRHLRLRGRRAVGRARRGGRRARRALPDGRLPGAARARADVVSHLTDDVRSAMGVNSRADLMEVEAPGPAPDPGRHAEAGVTFEAPDSIRVEVGVTIGADTTIAAGHHAARRHGDRRGLPDRPGDHDHRLHARRRRHRPALLPRRGTVEEGATLGPFAYLRPGAHIGEGAKIGTFVEVKNSEIGAGAKVPHLSYLGDADVGEAANIGAGNITANYDGFASTAPRSGTARRRASTPPSSPRQRRGRGVHWRRFGDHRGRPGRRPRDLPRQAEEHRGIRRAQEGAQMSSRHPVGPARARTSRPGTTSG